MSETQLNRPIINSPFLPPEFHWPVKRRRGEMVLGMAESGRFPASGLLPRGYAKRNPEVSVGMSEGVKRLELVNEIRALVGEWRERGFPGATAATRHLMAHWTDPDSRMKGLYFAQREAIATRVWLTEVAPQSENGRAILHEIAAANDDINDGVPRFCHMMATGTGKTAVMAALILWQTVNHAENPGDDRFTNRFLAIAPTITVKQRLDQGLRYKANGAVNARSEYASPHLNIVPPRFAEPRYLGAIDLTVVNFHKFIATTEKPNRAQTLAGQQPRDKTTDEIIRDVLGDNLRPAFVINDEAHHCHNGFGGRRNKKDEAVYAWHNGVKALRERGLIHGHVADMSATPFFIEDPKSSLFPWIVSQYDLREAESAGIVKIMRLPETGMDPEMARAIYAKTKDHKQITREDADSRNSDLKKALAAMRENWSRTASERRWVQSAAPPAMAVIVNTVANANALYDYVAGCAPEGEGVRMGQLAEFSNIDPNGEPYPIPRTILIHSKIDEPNGAITNRAQRAALDALAERYKAAYPTAETPGNVPLAAASTSDVMRTVLNTVGKPNAPGEKVRCVISVDMLSEGWDARNVTHIVGFKRFGTQLLCEQVSGRALRRLTLDVDEDTGLFPEEYADIIGIPFDSLGSRESGERPNPDPTDPVYVERVAERAEYALRWPNVIGYRQDIIGAGVAMQPPRDWNDVAPHRIPEHRRETVITAPNSPVGETEEIAANPISRTRFVFEVAGEVVKKAVEGAASGELEVRAVARGETFLAARKLVLAAFGACALVPPASGRFPNANSGEPRKAAEWLWSVAAVTREDAQARKSILIGEPEWLDAGALAPYHTARRHVHPTEKSEIGVAVCDSGWEVSAAKALDAHPAVSKWIRNERLGWTIPYLYDGLNRLYEPDFLAEMPLADGRGLNVAIEVKGKEHVADEAKRRYAEEWWIPCVNAHPEFGGGSRAWAYLYLDEDPDKDPSYVHRMLDAIKSEHE